MKYQWKKNGNIVQQPLRKIHSDYTSFQPLNQDSRSKHPWIKAKSKDKGEHRGKDSSYKYKIITAGK